MPTPSPSPAMLRAAAQIARETGCTVELPAKGGGVVRILPPAEKLAHPSPEPKPW